MSKRRRNNNHGLTEKLLKQKLVDEQLSCPQLALEMNCGETTVRKYATLYNIPLKKQRLDLIGRRFGRWFVEQLSLSQSQGNYRPRHWICICDCGERRSISTYTLTSGHSKSCGCFLKDAPFKGFNNISGLYWNRVKKGAQRRGIDFDIIIEYAWDVFVAQGGLCAMSGVPLVLSRNLYSRLQNGNLVYQTASLDRIESKFGYVEGNIQWVHKEINWLKHKLTPEELLSWCRKIVNYADSRVS